MEAGFASAPEPQDQPGCIIGFPPAGISLSYGLEEYNDIVYSNKKFKLSAMEKRSLDTRKYNIRRTASCFTHQLNLMGQSEDQRGFYSFHRLLRIWELIRQFDRSKSTASV